MRSFPLNLMPFILIYEPREGLAYYIQKYKGDWRLNGLRDNAYEFDTFKEASDIKERLRWLDLKIKEVK